MKGITRTVALAVSLTLLTVACGDGPEAPEAVGDDGGGATADGGGEAGQGITDDTITLGAIVPLTGPVAFGGEGGRIGMELYFDHINEEGGIHGRQVEVLYEDNEYDPGQTVSAAQKLWTSDGVFAIPGVFGSAPLLAANEYLSSQGIPASGWGPSSDVYCQTGDPIFGLGSRYEIQAAVAFEFIADDLGAKEDGAGVAVVIPDDAYGESILRGVEAAAENAEMELSTVERVSRTDQEFGTTVANLERSEAEYVILVPQRTGSAALLNEASARGLDVTWMSPSDATTETQVVELAGAYEDAYYGITSWSHWDDTDDQWISFIRDRLVESGDEDVIAEKNLFVIFGFLHAMLYAEGLEQAGENPTQEAFIEALSNLEGWDPGGLTAPVSYGEGAIRLPGTTAKVSKLAKDGDEFVLESQTDFREPSFDPPLPPECPNAE